MATVTFANAIFPLTRGGQLVTLRVAWGEGDTPLASDEECRISFRRYLVDGTEEAGACYSGRPQEPGLVPMPRDGIESRYLVHAYSPRLARGRYVVRLERRTIGGEAWTTVGDVATDALVHTPPFFEQVYDVRAMFPTPPHPAGPKSLADEQPVEEWA